MNRHHRRTLAALLIATAVAGPGRNADAVEAPLPEVGWWSQLPALAAPATQVGPSTIVVGATPIGATEIAAVRATSVPADTELQLTVDGAEPVQPAHLEICAAGSTWEPVDGGNWADRPQAECVDRIVVTLGPGQTQVAIPLEPDVPFDLVVRPDGTQIDVPYRLSLRVALVVLPGFSPPPNAAIVTVPPPTPTSTQPTPTAPPPLAVGTLPPPARPGATPAVPAPPAGTATPSQIAASALPGPSAPRWFGLVLLALLGAGGAWVLRRPEQRPPRSLLTPGTH